MQEGDQMIIEWKHYELKTFRVLLTSVFLVYRIFTLIALCKLFLDEYYKTFALLVISQIVQLSVSSNIVYSNFLNKINAQAIFWEIFYWIPRDREHQHALQKNSPFGQIIKILIPLVENLSFLSIIVFNYKNQSMIYIIAQMMSSFLFCFLIEIDNYKQKSFFQTVLSCGFKFVMMNVYFGYFLICHRSNWIYVYDITILVVSFGIICSNNFSHALLKFGYKHDRLDSRLVQLVQTGLIVHNFGFYSEFKVGSKDEKEQQALDQTNILCGIQVFQLCIFILFDNLVNERVENDIFRTILHIYLILIIFYLAKVFSWFINYIYYGPFRRGIQIDCFDIIDMSLKQIERTYFRFNSLQVNATIYIKNFLPQQFERLFSYLLKQDINLNIFLEGNLKLNYFLTKKIEGVIKLRLMNNEFTIQVVNQIIQNKHYKFMYSLQVNSHNQDIILQNFVKNYQIIPNILLKESQLNNSILFIATEVVKIVLYNKMIKEEMTFDPRQIYYDLFDI
ncbi:hypothetical protein ABPG74_009934 [Tetrahymena malaccensis]